MIPFGWPTGNLFIVHASQIMRFLHQDRSLALFATGMTAAMSAYGTKQTSISTLNVSAFGGKADIPDRLANVR